jgi:flavin reductase (DIM6/NTAB) family NADH-FMN oxidoreductase RutF
MSASELSQSMIHDASQDQINESETPKQDTKPTINDSNPTQPPNNTTTIFYRPTIDTPPLPYDPFKACVIPRPIGWISSINPSTGTHNLAPYSQFNNLTYDPPYVMFAANQTHLQSRKDSVANVEAAGYFGWNLATFALRDKVNASAEFLPAEVDEFERVGLVKEMGRVYPTLPLVAASPVRFECQYYTTLRLPGNPPMGSVDVVIGRVVGVHIAEWCLTDGKIDARKTQPIARMGYYEYTVVRDVFEMMIPGENEAILAGLEGSVKRSRKLPGANTKESDSSNNVERQEAVESDDR